MAFIDIKLNKEVEGDIPPSKYTSWLDFWNTNKNIKAQRCKIMGCLEKPDVAVNVLKVNSNNRNYVIPVCESCRKKMEEENLKTWSADLLPTIF